MITTTTGPWNFTASGSSGSFVIAAPVYVASALALYAFDPAVGSLYRPAAVVTLNADFSGATVAVASGLTAGHKVTVYRVPVQTQSQSLDPSGPLPGPVIERVMDRFAADLQAVRAMAERSLRLPMYEAAADELGVALLRAGMVLGFDGDGLPALLSAVPAASISVTSYMQAALGKSSAGALFTYLGVAAFMQGLFSTADAASLRTAAGVAYAAAADALAAASSTTVATPAALLGLFQTGTALASNATLDLTSGTTGFQRTVSDASSAIGTVQGTQPWVRLTAGADGVTLTHDNTKLISRTASDIVMRTGDSVLLLRIGTNQWREIAFFPVPNWKSGNITVTAGATLTAVPHYLGKRVGEIRLVGVNTSADSGWAPADFAATGARLVFDLTQTNVGALKRVDDTNVTLSIGSGGLNVVHKSTFATAQVDLTKWTFWLEIDPRN